MKAEFVKTICRRIYRRSQLRFTSNYFEVKNERLNLPRQFESEFVGDVNWGLLGRFSKSWMKVEFAKSVCRRNCQAKSIEFYFDLYRNHEWRLSLLRQLVSEFVGDVNWGLLGIFSKSWMKTKFAKSVCRRNCRRCQLRFTSIYFEVKNEELNLSKTICTANL